MHAETEIRIAPPDVRLCPLTDPCPFCGLEADPDHPWQLPCHHAVRRDAAEIEYVDG